MTQIPAKLLDLAAKCGRDWADQHPADEPCVTWSELTPDDCAWIKKSAPRLAAVYGPASAEAESAARSAYYARLRERSIAEGWSAENTQTIPAAPNRPRLDPAAPRVVRSYRLNPKTIAAIDAEAKRTGESAGQVVDRLALGLGVIMVPDGKAECPRCSCGGESRHAERVPAFVCQKCGALFRPVTSVERDMDKITTRFGDGSFETAYDDGMRIKGTSDHNES